MSSFNYGFNPAVIMWQVKDEIEGVSNLGEEESDDKELVSVNDPENDSTENERFYAYKFDATVSEGHRASATVTKFPVSSGFIVSDHIIKHNRILTLKVVAANMVNDTTWLMSLPGAMVAAGAAFGSAIGSIAGSATSVIQTTFETEDRVKSSYERFYNFMSNGTRLYVSTILGTYLNCIVVDIQVSQDKDTSSIMAGEIVLEELQTIHPRSDIAGLAARRAMKDMTDYSKFIKLAESVGINAIRML